MATPTPPPFAERMAEMRKQITPGVVREGLCTVIALRSASPILQGQLRTVQQLDGIERYRQWEDKDFTEIATALDSLIKEMGWSVQ